MKLIVLNLPRSFGEQDLAELFKDHGNVIAFNLVLDDNTGASKGFGFVEMELEEKRWVPLKNYITRPQHN